MQNCEAPNDARATQRTNRDATTIRLRVDTRAMRAAARVYFSFVAMPFIVSPRALRRIASRGLAPPASCSTCAASDSS